MAILPHRWNGNGGFSAIIWDGEDRAVGGSGWLPTRRACEQRLDRLIDACVEIAEQRQRPDEIGGEIGGQGAGKPSGEKPVKGRQAIRREKRAARHVAKVAAARDGRN